MTKELAAPSSKRCRRCKAVKGRSEFYVNKRSADGLAQYCIPCQKEYQKQWYETHRDKVNAKAKRWRNANQDKIRARLKATRERRLAKKKAHREANKDSVRAYGAAYRQRNRGRHLDYMRQYEARHRPQRLAYKKAYREANRNAISEKWSAWYEANREANRAKDRARRKANPHKSLAQGAVRRLRIAAAKIQTFTLDDLRERIKAFGGCCAYCGGPHEHMDHVKPLARGGRHCLANLRPACARCNQKKNAQDHKRWLSRLPHARPLPLP